MPFTLKITGPPAIEAAFTDFIPNMQKYGIEEPIRTVLKQAELLARSKSPVRTGFLRSSIRAETGPRGGRLIAAAPYALYVDKRVPYFSDAVDYINQTLPGLIQAAINEQQGRLSRKYFGG